MPRNHGVNGTGVKLEREIRQCSNILKISPRRSIQNPPTHAPHLLALRSHTLLGTIL